MLKARKKKKLQYQASTQVEAIQCGACNHLRQATDRGPEWQCPGCGKAYAKVNKKPAEGKFTPQELAQKNQAYLKKREALEQAESLKNTTSIGVGVGTLTLLNGLGKAASACVKVAVPANPILIGVGAAIIAGTLLYAAIKYLA